LTLSGLRFQEATNMPFWKIDKYVRKLYGPNPFRAHDVIGAKGANFLTWSCLHDLSLHYGKLFEPTNALVEHKNSGQNWYPFNHLRPIVNWSLDDNETEIFETWILGSLIQMTSLILHENRAHLSHINSIGELCAQFRSGIISTIRKLGYDATLKIVEQYHKLHPEAKEKSWYPEVFRKMDEPGWQQLYVNAEHNGKVGIITIGRESYNWDVNDELNRAIDWLKNEGIDRVILTGDFHLSTQLVGADTNDFFPALNNEDEGYKISYEWSKTARRLINEFRTSVGFINGKRCLGGMLELMCHCHYLIATNDVDLGCPEVSLPVVPGMEMCHLPFRKTNPENRQKLLVLLLSGKSIKASETVGWLVDFAGQLDNALKKAWAIVNEDDSSIQKREINESALKNFPTDVNGLKDSDEPAIIAARTSIIESIVNCCNTDLSNALNLQAKYSAKFMTGKFCRNGFIGSEFNKTMNV
jgi:enoyl-CoA hydratase/carnithine racemase